MPDKKKGDSVKKVRDSKTGRFIPVKDADKKYVRKEEDKPQDTQSTGPRKDKE